MVGPRTRAIAFPTPTPVASRYREAELLGIRLMRGVAHLVARRLDQRLLGGSTVCGFPLLGQRLWNPNGE
jgi:hypothetical protein